MKTSREPASPSQRGESEALLEVRRWKQAGYEEVKRNKLIIGGNHATGRSAGGGKMIDVRQPTDKKRI